MFYIKLAFTTFSRKMYKKNKKTDLIRKMT